MNFKQFIAEKIDFKSKYQQWIIDNFVFGIEIEGYLSYVKWDYRNQELRYNGMSLTSDYEEFYERLMDELNNEFDNIIKEVISDGSLISDHLGTGVEIISEIINFDDLVDINYVLEYLEDYYGIVFDDTCGLHISFSSPTIKNINQVNWLKVAILGGTEELAQKHNRTFTSMAASLKYFYSKLEKAWSISSLSDKETENSNKIYNVIQAMYEYRKGGKPVKRIGDYIKILEKLYTKVLSTGIGEKSERVGAKYSAINLSDFIKRNGRVEIRILGGDAANNYDEAIEDISNILNAVKVGMNDEYKQEYIDQLLDMIVDIVEENY